MRVWAVILFLPVVFYASAMQAALLFEGNRIPERTLSTHLELNQENAGWLLAAPGMSALAAISNDLRRSLFRQNVARPAAVHREFATIQLGRWRPYADLERGLIPPDALMVRRPIGIMPYYLPDLRIIDYYGLADWTIARNPYTLPNHTRYLAHDRRPPLGYLAERGVNFTMYPATSSEIEALNRGDYVVQVGPDLWMPFDTPDPAWAIARFSSLGPRFSAQGPSLVSAGKRLEQLFRTRRPVIRADFDVYYEEDQVIFVKDHCTSQEVEPKFFVHVFPVDRDDLPGHRKEYGFEALGFYFLEEGGVKFGEQCFGTADLPGYPIALIRVGQWIPSEGNVWEESFNPAET